MSVATAEATVGHCWYLGSSVLDTLTVGSVELMVARDISAREAFALTQGLNNDISGWQEYSLRKSAAFLRAWSLPTNLPDGDYTSRLDVLRNMRRGRFEQIYEAIVAHDASHERRLYKGQAVTPSEWSDRVKDDATLPKWEKLSAFIEPVDSVVSDSWFVTSDEVITLHLPDDHWIRVKSELTQGEHVQLVTAQGSTSEMVPANWLGARRMAFYLRDWSMVYPDGRKVPASIDSIAELDARRFSVMHQTLDAYEALLAKAREDRPTGAQ
jgi:hypothetical protein